jgi:Skp family chaperone for outer membrane proteins
MLHYLRTNATALVVTAGILGLVMVWPAEANRTTSIGPTVVATVDMQLVMGGLSERADLMVDLAANGQAIGEEEKTRAEEIERLAKELVDVVDDQRRTSLQDELDLKILQRMAWLRFTQQQIDIEKSLMLENLFRSMQSAAKELAEIEGIDLVIIDDAGQQFDLLPKSQLSREGQVAQQMTSRRVLYRDSAIDISEELIIRMNNDYAASTGTR